MSKELKYVRAENDSIVIFPTTVEHKIFNTMPIVTAGFCRIDEESKVVNCYGYSYSLSIGSDKTDTAMATLMVFGVDAMLSLKSE